MRVLITVPSLALEFGGPVAKARQLGVALRSLGHDVEILGCGSGGDATGLPVLGHFHATPVPRRLSPVRAGVRRAHILHVLGYRDPVGTVAAGAARRAGVPYVVEPAGMHARRLRSARLKAAFDATLGRRVLNGARLLIATSRLEAEELAVGGIQPERVRIRGNGVDLDGLLPAPPRGAFRRRLAIPSDAPLVLSLGRIARKKGLLLLAEALARTPGAWGAVVGPDDGDGTAKALESARPRLGLEGRLRVVPRGLWGRAKAEAFADADCFCLPSATENFGTAPAEAAALGIPVVVSDRCGVVEWLDPAATRVVPYGDVDLLARAIADALEAPAIREAARAAAPRVRAVFDWRALAARQHAIYREAVGEEVAVA